jgi:hypothetical protein
LLVRLDAVHWHEATTPNLSFFCLLAVAVIPWQHAGLGSQQQQQQSQQLQAQQLPLQEPTQHCQHDAQQQGPQGAVKQPWLQQACGNAVSLYDVDPLTRLRHGDPIADCFGAVTYSNGAVLALADGVNWGNRPKLAARAAVMAFVAHVHKVLQQLHAKGEFLQHQACSNYIKLPPAMFGLLPQAHAHEFAVALCAELQWVESRGGSWHHWLLEPNKLRQLWSALPAVFQA